MGMNGHQTLHAMEHLCLSCANSSVSGKVSPFRRPMRKRLFQRMPLVPALQEKQCGVLPPRWRRVSDRVPRKGSVGIFGVVHGLYHGMTVGLSS